VKPRQGGSGASQLRLSARPAAGAPARHIVDGTTDLCVDSGSGRPCLVRLPTLLRATGPAPLALLLHGSGGDPTQSLELLAPFADASGVVLVAPASVEYTWDMIAQGRFDADVDAIDRALAWVFERVWVDPDRLAIGGFSDGASYGLSLALENGSLFSHAIGMSPGFMAGTPGSAAVARAFLSHGRSDAVLPVACSRRILPTLRSAGVDVRYVEFDGGHVVPADVARSVVHWLVSG
jgi:phospholipase/carboxylesterase